MDGQVHVYEKGAYRGTFGSYVATDIFRVERKYGTVYYKRNGVTFYTSQVPSTSIIYADASFYSQGASLMNVTIGVGEAEVALVKNQYNELGQLCDKSLIGSSNNYLQSVDYRYNIRGWLTCINNAQLTQESLTNDDMDDLFGMELLYNTQDAGLGNSGLYNGNISAVKWKTPIEGSTPLEDRKSYKFSYDPMNRLSQASFAAYIGLPK
jgi:hypothetical protein